MHIILLVLGAVAALGGGGMIAYGIPINEFSFGNTLIISGVTALIGGLLLIGIAWVVRLLGRVIGELAHLRLVASGHMSFPAQDENLVSEDPDHLDYDRPILPQADIGDPHDEYSIDRPAVPEPASRFAERRTRADRIPRIDEDLSGVSIAPQEPSLRSESVERMAPRERPLRSWEAAVPSSEIDQRETERQSENAIPPQTEAAAQEPQRAEGVKILKSGVIDGMAYTLYSDGSIEAELPQGTLRFASIDELRAHIERRDS